MIKVVMPLPRKAFRDEPNNSWRCLTRAVNNGEKIQVLWLTCIGKLSSSNEENSLLVYNFICTWT